MTEVVQVLVHEPEVLHVAGAVLPGPPGPPGIGDMQKLIYDPHGFELDVFDVSHMTGNFDAGTF